MYNSDNRLYLITRDDLSPGLQAAQVAHGATEFALQFPEVTTQWHKDSNFVIVLSVADLAELHMVDARLKFGNCQHIAYMIEPDIGDELTCIAVGVETEVGQLLAHLPLALRQGVPV